MGAPPFQSTEQRDATLQVAAGFTGIQIQGPAASSARQPLIVSGVFQVPRETIDLVGKDLHKALALAVTRHPLHFAACPFRNAVQFPDDLQQVGNLWRGFFNVSVLDRAGMETPGTYYITFSLGTWLSNTLEVKIV